MRFNSYADWLAEAERRACAVENNGANRVVAHLDGYEVGEWDPNYGSAGFGWFK